MTKPPYVTAWSGEVGYAIRPSRMLDGRPAIFRATGRAGDGQPEWGIMSEERQRECVLRRKCQVCHRPLRPRAAFNLVQPRDIGLGVPATDEPPTCDRCVPTVLRLCPGVRRQLDAGVALLARVLDYGIAITPVQRAEGGNDDLNQALDGWRGEPPIGMCQVLLHRLERVTIEELESFG